MVYVLEVADAALGRTKALVDAADITALRDIEARLEGELGRLGKMEKHNDGVRRGWEGMTDEIRKARKALDQLIGDARSTLLALNIELQDEEVERRSPISVPTDPFGQGVLALPRNDVAR